jgi:magnesium chelatase subunit I
MADKTDHPEHFDSLPPIDDSESGETFSSIRSLRELIDLASGRAQREAVPQEDSRLAEILPFPFLGLVGQMEMKIALLLALINPAINGVLLLGPRGTGKTTAVRSLLDLLPEIERSACFYGCMPEDIQAGGLDAVCPDCARKYGEGLPLTIKDRVRLVELPLNAKLEDVVGGLDDRALFHEKVRLKRGILAQADRNILFIDEVNLLGDEIIDATLDAASQGSYTVHRGPITATYNARFNLIGSMNPEEGCLRPQIMDRFGLRVIVKGLSDAKDRLEAYQRVRSYLTNPHQMIAQYQSETELASNEILAARSLLPSVKIPSEIAHFGITIIQHLHIDSLRAEITIFEAARAYAAANNRTQVELEDIKMVALMSLRLRRSSFMTQYFKDQNEEDNDIEAAYNDL